MAQDWTNNDGLNVRFNGNIGKHLGRTAVTSSVDRVVEYIMTIDLVALGANGVSYNADPGNTGANTGFNNLDTAIQAGAIPIKTRVRTLVAPAGGTNYSVGTYNKDGTVINVAGFLTTAGADGTQIGVQTAVDLYQAVKVTGAYTAGKIEVITSVLIP